MHTREASITTNSMAPMSLMFSSIIYHRSISKNQEHHYRPEMAELLLLELPHIKQFTERAIYQTGGSLLTSNPGGRKKDPCQKKKINLCGVTGT